MLVTLTGSSQNFNGKLAGVEWKDGKAHVIRISRLLKSYGVEEYVEKKEVIVNISPFSTDISEEDEGVISKLIKEAHSKDVLGSENMKITSGSANLVEGTPNNEEKAVVDILILDKDSKTPETNTTPQASEEDTKLLSEITEKLKEDFIKKANKPETSNGIKTMEDFDNKWLKYKKYIKELTGTNPKDKEQAEVLREEYIKGFN